MSRVPHVLAVAIVAAVVAWAATSRGPAIKQAPTARVVESVHVSLGTPTDADPSHDYIIARPQYVTSYNRARNGPNWVAWRLRAADFGGQGRHHGHFITDDSLPDGWYRVQHADYTRTDYDRGHLLASEYRTASRVDNESTFLLSVVLPQRHDLNGGPWLRLEEACRHLAQHDGRELYIVAGGIFAAQPATIGHGIAVPLAWWKAVVVLAPEQGPEAVTAATRTIAVVMPNIDGIAAQPWAIYRTTLADVEQRSGYRLLGRVSEPVRRVLATQVDAQ